MPRFNRKSLAWVSPAVSRDSEFVGWEARPRAVQARGLLRKLALGSFRIADSQ
jgi:hypothetical protein